MAEVVSTVPSVGGRDAGYLFEFQETGVYLTVYPSDTELDFNVLQNILKENKADAYEMEVLVQALREKRGEPVKIAPPVPAAAASKEGTEEPRIKIDISRDKMSASVSFEINENSKKLTAEKVLAEIKNKGITFGISLEKIEEAVERPDEVTVIAEGILPQNGSDGRIKKYFDAVDRGRPVQDSMGRVDYKNLNLFMLVSAGDVLAERIPHTHGIPGTNIFGDSVAAKPGKPMAIPNGKNTKVEGETIIATMSGQVVESGKKISVDAVLSIKGDVDLATGNINFNGSVNISGGVQPGFFVKAAGDIEIKGTVSGAVVEGRNIIVSGGVQGMNRGHLYAREDFRASFAENANITAEKDIHISDVVLHSELRAGKKIVLEGHRGHIMGGAALAGEEIRAKIVGNSMNVSTKLEVGVNPMMRDKYTKLRSKLREEKEKFDQIHKTLQTLNGMDRSKFSQDKLEMFAQTTRLQFTMAGQIERDEKELEEMQQALEVMKTGKIRVSDKAYPGVKLVIASIMKTIQSEAQHCTFYVDQEESLIRIGAY